MNEKISIVIPAYNIQEHLGRCLDSVLAQSYPNLEVLVVNDGSTDRTAAVLDAYAAKDNRIKAIHKENGGVTSARLRGIAEASGDYIGFVDGDDYIEPQMYEQLLKNLQNNGGEISHCGYRMVFPDGHVEPYYGTGRLVQQERKTGCTDLLEGKFMEPGLVNKLYRRDLFRGLETWMDASIRINEDLLMNFYLFRQAEKAVFEDVCPYYYILRRGSAATSKLNAHKLRDPERVLRILLEETAAEPEWNRIVKRRLVYLLVNAATMSLGGQKELVKPHRQRARLELRRILWGVLMDRGYDIRLKCMALWAAVWPAGYELVHRAYAKARGTDKKFALE